jgi:ATP-binding cassette subfamily B protein
MALTSVAEMVSIGAILPFLAVLTAPDRLLDAKELGFIAQYLAAFETQTLLFVVTAVFSVAAILSGLLRFLLLWTQTRLGNAIGADLSISIYRRSLYQPYSVQVARNSSELIAGISTKANNVVNSALIPILVLISSMLMLIAILSMLLTIQPVMTVFAFVGFGSIYIVITFIVKKKLRSEGEKVSRQSVQVIKALQEGLGGIRDVLIDGTQEVYCKVYSTADRTFRSSQANIGILGSSPRFAIEALGTVLIAILAYFLASRPEGINEAIPLLGALTLGAQRLLPILQQSYSSWSGLKGGESLVRDALDLLDQPLPEHSKGIAIEPISFNSFITLENLSYKFAGHDKAVLDRLNFIVPKGSKVGVIGSTGSGKSTLLDVLMGLLLPTDGALKIDGQKITDTNYRSWQSHIAHVPQAIFLADATIAENVALGVEPKNIDWDRVKESLQRARILQTIETMPLGLKTVVGERGVRLSGGQRQRIGIARALYKYADVVILDEATSALDNETEREVMDSIYGLSDDLTIFIVAHRLSTLKNCTQIIELEQGQLKRFGQYEDLQIDKSV